MSSLPAPGRESPTRRRVQQVALDLFTRHGYDATSLRRIAEDVGVSKASLYHHFPSKAAIVRSLVEDRMQEVHDLVDWLRRQPSSPELLERAVLRWVSSDSVEKLGGIRFLTANPLVVRDLADEAGGIGDAIGAFVDELAARVGLTGPKDLLLLRMALVSLNAAVAASSPQDDDATILVSAERAARAMVGAIRWTDAT